MKKPCLKWIIIATLLILKAQKVVACDCDMQKPIMEFYASEVVFEGVVTEKIYTQDKQEFTVIFDVNRIFKGDPKIKTLEFTFQAESKYTGIYNSCDWSIRQGEEWVVYTYYKDNKLSFGGSCSNSGKLMNFGKRNTKQIEVLEKAQDFVLTDYIYRHEDGFTNPQPKINIDSLFAAAPKADFPKKHTILDLKIDEKGNLQGVFLLRPNNRLQHPIFKTTIEYEYSDQRQLNEFEKAASEILKELKHWEPKVFKKTGEAVRHHKHIHVMYDDKTHQWSYEL